MEDTKKMLSSSTISEVKPTNGNSAELAEAQKTISELKSKLSFLENSDSQFALFVF